MYKRLFLLLSLLCCMGVALAQTKVERSKTRSHLTYVFKLTNQEAKALYDFGPAAVSKSYFHTPVDSFALPGYYNRQLPYGHYLYVHSSGADLAYDLNTEAPFSIKLLQAKEAMGIIVHDSLGGILSNANVKVNRKNAPFDTDTKTYRIKRAPKQGIIAVEVKGITLYQSFEKERNEYRPSFLFKVTHFAPIYYIWKPFRDVYGTVRWGDPQGWVRRVVAVFDADHRKSNNSSFYRGYLVTNKPKYQPGDTVKYKAFVVNWKGKPVKENLQLELYSYDSKNKKLGVVAPFQEGAYESYFVLHDSLNLKLDRRCTIYLKKMGKQDVQVSAGSFAYEDYELKENEYKLSLTEKEHQTGQVNAVKVQGTDANGMNLLDARVELVATTMQVLGSPQSEVFVADTLWKHTQPLDAAGETTITLPESIFPKASINYKVSATFLNRSNERTQKAANAYYRYQKSRLKLSLLQDSLLVQYLEGDSSLQQKATLTTYSVEDDVLTAGELTLPAKVRLNPYAYWYDVKAGELGDNLDLEEEEAQLSLQTARTADSLFVAVQNPRKLPFWFYVYRGEKLVDSGENAEAGFYHKLKANNDKPYFVVVHHVWAGKVQKQESVVPIRERQLTIDLETPQVVYPGQKAEMKIAVKNYQGKPVEKVDLTAYAITAKFKEQGMPNLPTWDRYKAQKTVRPVSLTEDELSGRKALDWDYWGRRMGLDSMAYYNFLYPKSGVFKEYAYTLDSLTQVSPFVVDSGRVVPVHVVYMDEVPVYFSKTDVLNSYAFAADSGYHKIKLRTADKLITLDSVYLQHKMRLVISADITKPGNKFAAPAKRMHLDPFEQSRLFGYLFYVEKGAKEGMSYLMQGNHIQIIEKKDSPVNYYNRQSDRLLVGPFSPNWMQYVRHNTFRTNFMMEPAYSYYFEPSLLKMREQKMPDFMASLPYWNRQEKAPILLHQYVLTERKLTADWEAAQRQYYLGKIYSSTRSYQAAGGGKVGWQFHPKLKQQPELVFLHKSGKSDSLHVYPRETKTIYNLKPAKYKLTVTFEGGAYVAKEVEVKPNGLVHLFFDSTDVKPANKESAFLLHKVEAMITAHQQSEKVVEQQIQQLLQTQQQTTYSLTSGIEQFANEVSGVVTDKQTGGPLPGVAVLVKGTKVGTVTNANGFYKLYTPANGTLVFRYIGYSTNEENISNRSKINVTLSGDMKMLEEVVVVAYGMERSRTAMTASVASVLQGRVAGVQVQIRGNATLSAEDAKPLLIVDGVPYSGAQSDIKDILSINTLKGEEATALYGAAARAGVVIITTNKGGALAMGTPLADNLEQPQQANAIRSNFSDYAIWQPRLITNKQGEATFTATFPDDITNWNTYVLALNNKKQSGMYSTSIKSFKAMMATLHLPRFLVEGDKAHVVGKALNYLPDSTAVTTAFEVSGKKVKENKKILTRSFTDTLLITAPSTGPDSLEVVFRLQQANGFADGERRFVGIYPKGVKENFGQFFPLYTDTTLTLTFDPAKGPVTVRTQGDLLDVMLDEIDHLHKYEYWCSEQAASKLMALLYEKQIREQLGQEFAHERMVKKLIKHLERTQLNSGAWTWWEQGPAYTWISSHVGQALHMAKKEGYDTKYKQQDLINYLIYTAEGSHTGEKLAAVEALHQLNAPVDFARYLKGLEKQKYLTLEERLRLLLLQQKHNLPIQLDSLQKYKKQTMLGGLYWGEEKARLFNNNISNTLLAYQILRNLGNHARELAQIRAYLLSERGTGHWRNTYESAKVLQTLLPDLLAEVKSKTAEKSNKVRFSGALNFEATAYRTDTTFTGSTPLVVQKQGNLPVYFTAYQTVWNKTPEPVDKDFVVRTSLKGIKEGAELKAGVPVEMQIEVEVKADAEYVMLEVPIPASCSYDEKIGRSPYEAHREYLRDKVSIFSNKLAKGKYTYTIKLLPRYTGTYTLNPAKAELMYFPTFFGRTGLKKVTVR